MAVAGYFRDLVDGKRHTIVEELLFLLLKLLSYPYALALRLRAVAYGAGLFAAHTLDCPVISVGNLTVGGTGKTPAVAMLAKFFISRGKRVAVLSRGYGGSRRGEVVVADGSSLLLTPDVSGDEPYLLASTVPGLMAVVGANRYRAGLLAQERLHPDIIILDDGYQHLRLRRDLDILLLDCSRPFGNGLTLPAGLLREPPFAAQRADLVIYTRCSSGEEPDYFPGKPSCRAFHHLTGIIPLGGGETLPFAFLAGQRGLAFAGIADPAGFFRDLEEEGLNLAATLAFPDHCHFGEREIRDIQGAAEACRAEFIVTTEKDGVKLMPYLERLGTIYTTCLEMWIADPGPLLSALEKLL